MSKRFNRRRIVTWIIIISVFFLGTNRISSYLHNYYPATSAALACISSPAEGITVDYLDNTIVFKPENPTAGLIFYPGGLVQTEAYAPLMEQLAQQNIMCVLVEMPYYLALFDANAARGIQAQFPEISDWYIGGHSLGGAMASLYADRHKEEYEGLILLAAYSMVDLTDGAPVDVLTIRGSEDGILNMKNYNKNLSNLPTDYTEVIIEGGCHGYFGDYGMQAGDGTPTITVQEQTTQTVDAILNFMNK